ncbi:putative Ulp1 peptidase [Helianthus annuus]|nr:putative Ulp1 peptidase [Helianthus annuus]KAJ0596332.1 putative Ulp1 peptidase [Helianthus annuus]KAJ0760724.1 putative Ulp1 peptidase [Helianthus annuus]
MQSFDHRQLINVYLELLKERESRKHKKFLKSHFFNTYFYKKILTLIRYLSLSTKKYIGV